jgi:ribonuclease P protein component
MRLSTEFGSTVKRGERAVERDLVVHARRSEDRADPGPRIGLVVGKTVGTAWRDDCAVLLGRL